MQPDVVGAARNLLHQRILALLQEAEHAEQGQRALVELLLLRNGQTCQLADAHHLGTTDATTEATNTVQGKQARIQL